MANCLLTPLIIEREIEVRGWVPSDFEVSVGNERNELHWDGIEVSLTKGDERFSFWLTPQDLIKSLDEVSRIMGEKITDIVERIEAIPAWPVDVCSG